MCILSSLQQQIKKLSKDVLLKKKTTGKLKWNTKNFQTTQKRAGKGKERNKSRDDKNKTKSTKKPSNKMQDINLSMSAIKLNANGLTSSMERERETVRIDKKTW